MEEQNTLLETSPTEAILARQMGQPREEEKGGPWGEVGERENK